MGGVDKMKKWQLVEVTWLDAIHHSGWTYEDEIDWSDKKLIHTTAGYFLGETKSQMLIVQSRNSGDEVDAIMHLPKTSIKKIRKLR